MLRANIGCGSIRPEGWDNFDHCARREDIGQIQRWNVLGPLLWGTTNLKWNEDYGIVDTDYSFDHQVGDEAFPPVIDHYDYAVCSFMLQELTHHRIPEALTNMMAILKPGGVLRVLVPDVFQAVNAYYDDDEDWFPQDERTGDLDAKFCTYVTWFGESRSVFTPPYLRRFLQPHGRVTRCDFGGTTSRHYEIVGLDSRPKEALIMEVTKP